MREFTQEVLNFPGSQKKTPRLSVLKSNKLVFHRFKMLYVFYVIMVYCDSYSKYRVKMCVRAHSIFSLLKIVDGILLNTVFIQPKDFLLVISGSFMLKRVIY